MISRRLLIDRQHALREKLMVTYAVSLPESLFARDMRWRRWAFVDIHAERAFMLKMSFRLTPAVVWLAFIDLLRRRWVPHRASPSEKEEAMMISLSGNEHFAKFSSFSKVVPITQATRRFIYAIRLYCRWLIEMVFDARAYLSRKRVFDAAYALRITLTITTPPNIIYKLPCYAYISSNTG